MSLLTNGEVCGPGLDEGQVRKFRYEASFKNVLWVEAMNGNYKGEMRTFHADALKKIKHYNKEISNVSS